MGQLDPWGAMATQRSPQPKDHPARLKERNLVVGLLRATPSQRLVESVVPELDLLTTSRATGSRGGSWFESTVAHHSSGVAAF